MVSTIATTWLLQYLFALAAHMMPRPKPRGRRLYKTLYRVVQFTAANIDRFRQVGR